jgi:beta-lactamase class A
MCKPDSFGLEPPMRPLIAILFLTMLFAAPVPGRIQVDKAGRAGNQKQELLWRKLENDVTRIDDDLDAVVGIAILDLTSGRVLLHNADEVFPTASSIKIAVLAELYHQSAEGAAGATGKARLDDGYTVDKRDLVPGSDIMAGLTPGVTRVTNRDLATFMIAVSDNSATNVLIDRVGLENVNALASAIGLRETRLRRKMMDLNAAREGRENTSTPREMVMLLEAIYRNKFFNEAMTADFFKMLATHKDSEIPRLLPDSVVVADKPGSLESVRTDSGIVFAKNRPFAISVMTTYAKDERAAEMAISRISLAAFEFFDRLGRASSYGRVVSPK